jgi:SNW domain-containing protein 1
MASGLFKSLPKPKYTGDEEELPQHAQPRGPRVVGADQVDETQVVLRVSLLSKVLSADSKLTCSI